MGRRLRCVPKVSSVAKAGGYPTSEDSSGPAAVNLSEGDLVDIWIHAANKWFTDGLIAEVRHEASTTSDGRPLPAGCAKIVYNNGTCAKWLQPDLLNNRNVVKPFPKPPHFQGLMQKQTHHLASQWNVRQFEIRDGFLKWWKTQIDYVSGDKPQGSLHLIGLQMPKIAVDKPTQIAIRTASSKGVVYNLDINAGDADGGLLGLRCLKDRTSEEYATALQQHVFLFRQHGAYADRVHKMQVGSR